MARHKASKGYQGPALFFDLASETRARIYRYYFPGAIVRFTRPSNGAKARVYFKSKIDLMLICRKIYLESHPIYSASLRVILRNVEIPRLRSDHSPFKFIKLVEIVDGMKQSFTITDLPALQTLKISIPATTRGYLRTRNALLPNQFQRFFDGSLDYQFKQSAKDETMKYRTLQLALQYPNDYEPCVARLTPGDAINRSTGPNWLSALVLDRHKEFQIIDTVIVHFPSPGYWLDWRSYESSELMLQYDVDTLDTVNRILFDHQCNSMEVWEDDVVNIYQLRKGRMPGRLLDSRPLVTDAED